MRLTAIALAVYAVISSAGFAATQGSAPWLGTTERASIYVWMLWIAVLAVAFLPKREPGV